jgi:hypothetical protein
MSEEIVLRGWIQPCENTSNVANYRRVLEEAGVRVGPWNESGWMFQDCVVPASAFERLNPLWGQYIWGLS